MIEATENIDGEMTIISCDDYPIIIDTVLGGWSEFTKPDERVYLMEKVLVNFLIFINKN